MAGVTYNRYRLMRRSPGLPYLLHIARRLRKKQTPAEQILWALLRGRKCLGLKFRRQHLIGSFFADFYCDEARLVIELDGGVHTAPEQAASDHNRDIYLRGHRYLVLRFENQQLLDDPESLLREIARATGRWWE